MEPLPKCPRNLPPVVRLALKREKCPRGTGLRLRTENDVAAYVQRMYGCEAQEWAVVVGLDSTSQPLGIHEVAVGGLAHTSVDPKVVFAGLLLMGASSFIFFHNHPSGSTQPSAEDVNLTKQLKQVGQLMTIRMLDHIIVSSSGRTSFLAQGLL